MEPKVFESLYPGDVRFNEIEQVKAYISSGNSCQIIGVPGSGKSNFLKFLAYNHAVREKHLGENQKYVHFVMVNFAEVRNREPYDAVKLLLISLVESLRERQMQAEYREVDKILKDVLTYKDEMVMFQGLKRAVDFLALEKKLTIVFLFDRFDAYIPRLTPQFFTNLRTLRDRVKYRFSVLFSLNRPLEDLIDSVVLQDIYEFVSEHTVYIPIADPSGTVFRLQYLEKVTDKKIGDNMHKCILAETGGHVRLVRLAAEAVLANKPLTLTVDFLLKQKNVFSALLDIWRGLTPAEQELLEGVVSGEDVKFTDTDYLVRAGIISQDAVSMPLFAEFIKQEMTGEKEKDAHIVIREDKEIFKGESNLSDNLTASENRLLFFLLAHPDRVVERDDIVNAVWRDNASTAGVTEQAIDQLIFRLRKKIEDEPTSPTHLLTVKGRGVRFLP